MENEDIFKEKRILIVNSVHLKFLKRKFLKYHEGL